MKTTKEERNYSKYKMLNVLNTVLDKKIRDSFEKLIDNPNVSEKEVKKEYEKNLSIALSNYKKLIEEAEKEDSKSNLSKSFKLFGFSFRLKIEADSHPDPFVRKEIKKFCMQIAIQCF